MVIDIFIGREGKFELYHKMQNNKLMVQAEKDILQLAVINFGRYEQTLLQYTVKYTVLE